MLDLVVPVTSHVQTCVCTYVHVHMIRIMYISTYKLYWLYQAHGTNVCISKCNTVWSCAALTMWERPSLD